MPRLDEILQVTHAVFVINNLKINKEVLKGFSIHVPESWMKIKQGGVEKVQHLHTRELHED